MIIARPPKTKDELSLPGSPLTTAPLLAGSAVSPTPTFLQAGVVGGKLVAPLAVGGGCPLTSAHVLRMSHRLKMVGVHAPPVPAEVIEFKPFGDRADEVLVDQDMSQPSAVASPSVPAIALWGPVAGPFPAANSLVDLLHHERGVQRHEVNGTSWP